MAQQPNIELRITDLPRPTPSPDPARSWTPNRPGDLQGPEDTPWGGLYGTPGPDAGYVLRLVANLQIAIGTGESQEDGRRAVAILAAARASRAGRGPTGSDVAVARMLLGYSDDLDESTRRRLAQRRYERVAGISHHTHMAGALVDAVDTGLLSSEPSEVVSRLQAGSSPFTDD